MKRASTLLGILPTYRLRFLARKIRLARIPFIIAIISPSLSKVLDHLGDAPYP